MSEITRRAFFRWTGAGTLAVMVPTTFGMAQAAAMTTGTLDPSAIGKFTTALPIPGAIKRTSMLPVKGGRNGDYYEISVRQIAQQILPAGMPATTVWGYGPVGGQHTSPGMTIEAEAGLPVRVKWVNDLVDAQGSYLPHLLPVDPTLHWANPGQHPDVGGVAHTDNRPDYSGLTYVPPGQPVNPASQYSLYRGPSPLVTHLHGAVAVGDESDGYPEAWYLPAATNIPAGYAAHGTWYPFFAGKAASRFGTTWGPGYAVATYPNSNRASTLWYHDHALGMTRLNVYAGLAGFYIVRGGPGGDDNVLDSRVQRKTARLPGPAPKPGVTARKDYFEIPVVIQDRSFNADGSLFYPDSREFFDGYAGPFVPASLVSPAWNPEFFGDTIMVNGATWPSLAVTRQRYRLRLLNGCQSRFLDLDFTGIPGVSVWQIGNDGGFLPAPLDVMAPGPGGSGGRLFLAPSERADIIVDFAGVAPGSYVLGNTGPDEPYKGPGVPLPPANPATTGQIMQFQVSNKKVTDLSTPPQFLTLPAAAASPAPVRTRRLALLEQAVEVGGGDFPIFALLGTVDADPATGPATATALSWMDPVTENPAPGDTEIWEIYNLTEDAHPIHVHDVAFEVVNREPVTVGDGTVQLIGAAPVAPSAGEGGRKDTFVALPGHVNRLRIQFPTAGQYVWHCHILEHEDHEMMRPLRIGPPQPGQPA